MAVVDTLSTTITNLNASPLVVSDVANSHGRLRIKTESVTMATADDNGSTYRLFRVRSSDSIKSLTIYCTAITGASDVDLGLYTINGGAAVDADLYADGITLATAAPSAQPPTTAATSQGIECRFGDSVTALVSDINNKVWQDLGLTSDPGLTYDMVLTANAAASTDGTATLVMVYTAGD